MSKITQIGTRFYSVENKQFAVVRSTDGRSTGLVLEAGSRKEIGGGAPEWIKVQLLNRDGRLSKKEPFWTKYSKWVKTDEVELDLPMYETNANGKMLPGEFIDKHFETGVKSVFFILFGLIPLYYTIKAIIEKISN
ncbi:hypothetical protein QEH56_24215 [Pelagicoccus enzymogenes]|uniref:hypothetical protein n=1 Tax=Pelagicoccus enzymogenes TaxID=2773457 RepID=UPI00280D4668|nr:hypothetical protein [Pelagicoccus enzymogenes]MDQ8201287.1 hypothetical protein [Pelagicoccus enzymogenes]